MSQTLFGRLCGSGMAGSERNESARAAPGRALPSTNINRFSPKRLPLPAFKRSFPIPKPLPSTLPAVCSSTVGIPLTTSAPAVQIPLGMDLASYPSMQGRNILVTGAARGIGFHTARLLALLDANVYITDMQPDAIAAAVADIAAQQPRAAIYAAPAMNLANLQSVAVFADSFARQLAGAPLHVLLNNAGANFMGCEPWRTPGGVAGLPAVNVLGPFALTQQLQPLLAAADAARVVNVASVMHRKAQLPSDLDDFFRDWWVGGSYRNCKLAAVLLTQELQRRWGYSGLTAMAVDPGAVHSAIWDTSKTLGKPPGSWIVKTLFSPTWDAAATSVHAAATADPEPAGYYARGLFAADDMVAPVDTAAALRSTPLPILDWPLRRATGGSFAAGIRSVSVAAAAQDEDAAAALWEACCKRAGLLPSELLVASG